MAPELLYPTKYGLSRSQPSKEGDIYALGMVVYEVVTGVRPFGVENYRANELAYKVLEGIRPVKPENADTIGFGGGVWGLVEACWEEDRTQRPRTGEARQRLTVAASWSRIVPLGPMVAVRQTSTDSATCSVPGKWHMHSPPLSTPTYQYPQSNYSTIHSNKSPRST